MSDMLVMQAQFYNVYIDWSFMMFILIDVSSDCTLFFSFLLSSVHIKISWKDIKTLAYLATILRISWQGKPSEVIPRLICIQATHPINKMLKKLSCKNHFYVLYTFASAFFSPLVLVEMTMYNSHAHLFIH